MSEDVAVVEQEEAAATKRKTLSLGERIKVVDYLRAQVEPIVADSNAAVAAIVSEATKVDINWQQLKYMIDDLTEMNLGSKVYVKTAASGEEAAEARIAQLEACVVALTKGLDDAHACFAKLSDRMLHLESNLRTSE